MASRAREVSIHVTLTKGFHTAFNFGLFRDALKKLELGTMMDAP